MIGKRKSKIVHWEIMSELEEAGEEDLCSLMNQVMGVQPYFGSGRDLTEYLEAVAALENQGELRVRAYRIEEGRIILGELIAGNIRERPEAFRFDAAKRIWRWDAPVRQLVELPDE